MTREETIKILERICKLYMTQARRLTPDQKAAMIDTWADTFRRDTYEAVDGAVNKYIRSGKVYMPGVPDIMNILAQSPAAPKATSFTEADKLFNVLVNTAQMLAEGREHQSIIDPGGFRYDPEFDRKVYKHAEVRMTTDGFTQYDFKQLPIEVQEYVEDIDGLRSIWREIESSRVMAKRRFENELPDIKAEIAKREDRNIKENKERLEALFEKTNRRVRWRPA